MRFIITFFALLAHVSFTACNNNDAANTPGIDTIQQQRPIQDGTYVEDSVAIPLDTTQPIPAKPISKESNNTTIDENEITTTEPEPAVKKIKNPQGIYTCTLPCFDCKGIEHTVAFYPNKQYKMEEKQLEKDKNITKTAGHFNATGNTIWLYKDQIVKARYTWQGDTLVYIEPKTNTYIALRKLNSITENETWMNKKKKDIHFYGIGNEPFWNIEVDNNKNIAFKLADWPDKKDFTTNTTEANRDSVYYAAKNDSSQLKVTIYNNFCRDGMSDYIYTNSVKVVYNNQTFNGCGYVYK